MYLGRWSAGPLGDGGRVGGGGHIAAAAGFWEPGWGLLYWLAPCLCLWLDNGNFSCGDGCPSPGGTLVTGGVVDDLKFTGAICDVGIFAAVPA